MTIIYYPLYFGILIFLLDSKKLELISVPNWLEVLGQIEGFARLLLIPN